MRRAITRSLRACPPDSVLAAVLVRDLEVTIAPSTGIICAQAGHGVQLSPSEYLALEILAGSDGAMTIKDFQRAFVRRGLSAGMAGVIASRSPVIARPQLGTVTTIGSSVNATVLDKLAEQVKKDADGSLLGYRRLPDGSAELVYRVDPSLLSATLFALPAGVLAEGTWHVDDRASGQVRVKKTYLTGIHRYVRTHLEDKPRTIALIFDPKVRKLRIKTK
jgi:hypothetical protein